MRPERLTMTTASGPPAPRRSRWAAVTAPLKPAPMTTTVRDVGMVSSQVKSVHHRGTEDTEKTREESEERIDYCGSEGFPFFLSIFLSVFFSVFFSVPSVPLW